MLGDLDEARTKLGKERSIVKSVYHFFKNTFPSLALNFCDWNVFGHGGTLADPDGGEKDAKFAEGGNK